MTGSKGLKHTVGWIHPTRNLLCVYPWSPSPLWIFFYYNPCLQLFLGSPLGPTLPRHLLPQPMDEQGSDGLQTKYCQLKVRRRPQGHTFDTRLQTYTLSGRPTTNVVKDTTTLRNDTLRILLSVGWTTIHKFHPHHTQKSLWVHKVTKSTLRHRNPLVWDTHIHTYIYVHKSEKEFVRDCTTQTDRNLHSVTDHKYGSQNSQE